MYTCILLNIDISVTCLNEMKIKYLFVDYSRVDLLRFLLISLSSSSLPASLTRMLHQKSMSAFKSFRIFLSPGVRSERV